MKIMENELENDFVDICRAIHNYSFDIFAHRVAKRKHELSHIRRYIEQDQMHFTAQQRSTLVGFLYHVDSIIKKVAKAQTKKQLPAVFIKLLLRMYSFWTEQKLLPEDSLPDNLNKFTLLDLADTWLASGA